MSADSLLQALLSQSQCHVEIDKLYSTSRHKVKAREILNLILHEHPEYYPTICCLTSHNIQKWASYQRSHIHINFEGLAKDILIFEHCDNEDNFRRLKVQSITIKKTSDAMKYLESIVSPDTKEGKTLYDLHFEGKPVSKYLMNNYYERAVLDLCEKHNDEFKTLLGGEMIEPYLNGENDSHIAYHNTYILLKLFPKLARKHLLPNELVITIRDCLIKCFEALKTAEDGEETYKILAMHAKGMSEIKIAESIERNRKYVSSRIKYGIELLSYIIWGYGTREIMSNVSKYHN